MTFKIRIEKAEGSKKVNNLLSFQSSPGLCFQAFKLVWLGHFQKEILEYYIQKYHFILNQN